GFAFHHRLARQGSDVAQSQDRSAVRHDGDQVTLPRVPERGIRVLLDEAARQRHAGRVGEGEATLGHEGLRCDDFQLARFLTLVILEDLLLLYLHAASRSAGLRHTPGPPLTPGRTPGAGQVGATRVAAIAIP